MKALAVSSGSLFLVSFPRHRVFWWFVLRFVSPRGEGRTLEWLPLSAGNRRLSGNVEGGCVANDSLLFTLVARWSEGALVGICQC